MKTKIRSQFLVRLSNNSFGKNYDQYIVQSRRLSNPPTLDEVEGWIRKHVLKGAEARVVVEAHGQDAQRQNYYQMR